MSAKDLLLNFLYIAFFVLLVGSCIIFFIQGDRFSTFATFLRSAWPIAFFLGALAIKLRLTQSEKRAGEGTGLSLRTLSLSFGDKMKAEFIAYALPLVILFIAAFLDEGVQTSDIIQAVCVFLIAFLWHKYLWLRAR